MYERVSVWAFVHEKAFWCRQGARRADRLELPAGPSRRRGYIPAAVPTPIVPTSVQNNHPNRHFRLGPAIPVIPLPASLGTLRLYALRKTSSGFKVFLTTCGT